MNDLYLQAGQVGMTTGLMFGISFWISFRIIEIITSRKFSSILFKIIFGRRPDQ